MEECERNYWEGVSGDDLAIPFQLIGADGNPVKIGEGDGCTEICAEFKNGSGFGVQQRLSKEMITIVDSTTGRGLVIVPAETCATLVAHDQKRQTFTIFAVINDLQQTWIFEQGLLLKRRPIPPPAA